MNELSELFRNVSDGDNITLEKDKIYSVAPEDSFHLKGFFFSNTAKQAENPEGERFSAIYLESVNNVTVDGNGATVMIHGKMTPFLFHRCKNITLKNLRIDHWRPTMSEFTIVESAPGYALIKINSEFLYRIENNILYWHSENDFSGKPYWEIPYKGKGVLTNAYDPKTEIIDDMICGEGDSWHGFPDILELKEIEKGLVELKFRDSKKLISAGTVAQTRSIIRVQTGGAIDKCEDVTLENLRIMSMNGFGILGQNSKNLTYINLDCTPTEGRTIVSDADFFHFSGCSGEVKVLGCKAKGAHDDIINIHGTHLKIIELDRKNNTVLLRYSHLESWGFEAYEKGDKIEYVSGNTLLPYGEANVLCVEQKSPTDFLVFVDSLPDRNPAENDVVENVTRTASLLVENNVFERIPSRAILCTTRKDVVIRNNTFRNMGASALCVADDANFWFESGRSGNIYFENNIVVNCAARYKSCGSDVIRYEPVVMDKESTEAVHKNLYVRNNHFFNSNGDKYIIDLNYLENSEITDNTSDVPLEIISSNFHKN